MIRIQKSETRILKSKARKILPFVFFFLLSAFSFLASTPPADASCFNPAGNAGNVIYNGGYGVVQYCNGGAWIPIGHVGSMTGGLAGWWKFDDGSGTTAADSSGNGNTGTLVNTPTWTTGMNGGALTFNGTNQYVNGGNGATLSVTNFTVSFWMNAVNASDSAVVEQPIIKAVSNANNDYNFQFAWRHSNGGAYPKSCAFRDAAHADHLVQIAGTMKPGAWYMVTCTYDGANLKVYLNGTLDSTTATAATPITGPYNLFIGSGATNNVPGSFFNGTIDDARVYSRALSAADIRTLYTSTGGESGDINSNLVGYWKLDEASGTVANDSTGNGNTGTTVNSPTWGAGKVNNALTFDNSATQYVDAGNGASITSLSSFSYAAWVYPTATPSGEAAVISKSLKGLDLNVADTSWHGVVDCSGTNADAIGGSFALNAWQHLAMTYDGPTLTLKLYENGILVASSTCTGVASPDSPYNLNFGRSQAGGFYFPGTIDEVRVYSRALSPADVLTLYNFTNTACASPTGYAGDLIYNNGANHVEQYCNGSSWIPAGKVPGAGTGPGCSNPAGSEGDTIYNKDYYALQYCDGTNWVVMGQKALTGLVGWWNFDEGSGTSAADSSGNNNTGTLINSPTWTTSGKFNGALTLNDVAHQYVDVGNSASINNLSSFTWAAWVYGLVVPGSPAPIISKSLKELRYNGVGSWEGVVLTSSSNADAVGGSIDTNAWQHIAMTFSAATMTVNLYKNGILVASNTGTGSVDVDSASNLSIGSNPGNGWYFPGIIDDVRVYNRALGAGEIAHLYNGGP